MNRIISFGFLNKIFIAAIFITGLTSCEKFLEVEPKTSTSDAVTIVDENSAKTAVRGIYNQLQSGGYYGFTFPLIGNISADNVQYTGSQAVNSTLTTHTARADLGPLATVWEAIYNTINRANNVIAKVPDVPLTTSFTEGVRNQLVGEAYFLRALAYFDLVRTWGGVQLILEPTASAGNITSVPRSSVQETYARVLEDLKSAEALLPETINRIRATRQTVFALRARYHLYQKEWQDAIIYAGKVIDNNGGYALVKPYNSFFANNSANTSESVFELYYNLTVTNTQGYNWQHSSRGGIGWVRPSDEAAALLSDANIAGDRSSLLVNIPVNGVNTWYGNLYYRTNGTDPAYLIRLAELYLIRAEAKASLSTPDLAGALQDLDVIRTRANLPGSTATTQAEVLLAIELENRIEFAFENHRWFDLIRTGRAQEVLNITNPQKLLLPVPYSQILVDPALQQNPGYED